MAARPKCTCPHFDQRDAPEGHSWIDGGCPLHGAISRGLRIEEIEATRRDLDRVFPGMLEEMGDATANQAKREPKGQGPSRSTKEFLDLEPPRPSMNRRGVAGLAIPVQYLGSACIKLARRLEEASLDPQVKSMRMAIRERARHVVVDVEGWMHAALPALRGRTPSEYARTVSGAQEVLHLIERIRQGVVS